MTRLLLAVLVATALVGAWIVVPPPTPPPEPPGLEPAAAAAATCPVVLDRTGGGKLTFASTAMISPRVTVGNAGDVAVDRSLTLDSAGGTSLLFDDLGVGGYLGAFVEFGVDSSAAGSVFRGSAGVGAASCSPVVRTTSVLAGGSTRNGESLELVLVNPYGSDAVVGIQSASEVGADSADELTTVVVPARSTVTRDLATLLPLRTRLSVSVVPARGLVHAFLIGGGGDRVVVEQAEPGTQWSAPVPAVEGLEPSLVIASVSPVEVAVRVDAWVGGEVNEGIFSGVVAPRGQIELPLSPAGAPFEIVQVLADGPVATAMVVEGEGARGVTPATAEPLLEWLVPGPGSAGSVVWIGVPGPDGGTVEFLSLTEGRDSFVVDVPAGRMTAVPVDGQPVGYFLRADVPITVLWSVSDDTGLGLGTPRGVLGGE